MKKLLKQNPVTEKDIKDHYNQVSSSHNLVKDEKTAKEIKEK